MSQLRKELNKTAYKIIDDVRDILGNQNIKAEKRRNDLIWMAWRQDLETAKCNVDNTYDKLVIYSFQNMLTYKHSDNLSTNELVSYISALASIMQKTKDGDFNEE